MEYLMHLEVTYRSTLTLGCKIKVVPVYSKAVKAAGQ